MVRGELRIGRHAGQELGHGLRRLDVQPDVSRQRPAGLRDEVGADDQPPAGPLARRPEAVDLTGEDDQAGAFAQLMGLEVHHVGVGPGAHEHEELEVDPLEAALRLGRHASPQLLGVDDFDVVSVRPVMRSVVDRHDLGHVPFLPSSTPFRPCRVL